jgi:hypothetical protein
LPAAPARAIYPCHLPLRIRDLGVSWTWRWRCGVFHEESPVSLRERILTEVTWTKWEASCIVSDLACLGLLSAARRKGPPGPVAESGQAMRIAALRRSEPWLRAFTPMALAEPGSPRKPSTGLGVQDQKRAWRDKRSFRPPPDRVASLTKTGPLLRISRNGETRTRTGDTTIFRNRKTGWETLRELCKPTVRR